MERITSSVSQADAAQSQTNTQTSAQTSAQETQNQFLQLLVAQLKGQNPLDPMDGSQFVAQLAQFSSLEELTKIRGNTDSIQQLLNQPKQNTSAGNPFQTNTEN